MLVAAQLGGFREDATSALALVLGQQGAADFVAGMEEHIKLQARAGAEQAIPKIRTEVRAEAKSAVRPYVIGALAVSGLAVLLGGIALYRSS